jgi:hypothetical protein
MVARISIFRFSIAMDLDRSLRFGSSVSRASYAAPVLDTTNLPLERSAMKKHTLAAPPMRLVLRAR